jgi:heme oxygenase
MSPAFNVLKSATKTFHDELEANSYVEELMSQRLSLSQYQNLISKNLIIFQAIEGNLNNYLSEQKDPLFLFFQSNRVPDLQKDLAYFSNKHDTSTSSSVLQIDEMSVPHFLGALYVLEGSRLGGNVVGKALRKNPNLVDIPAFHFYTQEGVDIRSRWVSFIKMATPILAKKADLESAVEGAKEMFEYFNSVFSSSQY